MKEASITLERNEWITIFSNHARAFVLEDVDGALVVAISRDGKIDDVKIVVDKNKIVVTEASRGGEK